MAIFLCKPSEKNVLDNICINTFICAMLPWQVLYVSHGRRLFWTICVQIYYTTRYYGFTLDVRVSVHPSVNHTSIRFSLPDDNLSKHQWIFMKLGMCIDIVEI